MDTRIAILGIAEPPHESRDRVQSRLDTETPQTIEGGQMFIKAGNHKMSVLEAPLAGVHHSYIGLIAGLDRLVVVQGPSGLDYC